MRIHQSDASLLQAWLCSVHLAASALALAFATTHLVASLYHLERVKQPSVADEADEFLKELQHGAK